MNKEVKKLMKKCRQQGCFVEQSGAGHVKVWIPGRNRPVTMSLSPSNATGWKNARADLRRAGLDV